MPTPHICIEKGEQSLFDADFLCDRNCCGTEQSIQHIYTNFQNHKLHTAKHLKMVPGFLEYGIFEQMAFFFLNKIAVKVKKYAMFSTMIKRKEFELMADLHPVYMHRII